MKNPIPTPVIIGVAVVVIAVIGFFAYNTFLKPTPQVDVKTLPPERLLDPDGTR